MKNLRGLLSVVLLGGLAIFGCTTAAQQASNIICTPSQQVRCNDCPSDCSAPAGEVCSGWITCSGDGTEFIGECKQCAAVDPNDPNANVYDAGQYTYTGFDSGTTYSVHDSGGGKKTADSSTQTQTMGGQDSGSGSSDPCSGALNGEYCGNSFPNGTAGQPNTLYTCLDNATETSQPCPNGCLNNACSPNSPPPPPPPPTPPSNLCQTLGDGAYCGNDPDLNGVWPEADPNTLYQCLGGSLSGSMACSNGCTYIPNSSEDDYCN